MPPDMSSLPVPRPGASRPQERSLREQAEAALVPSLALEAPRSRASTGRSAGEVALVASAGGAPANDSIRQQVDEESLRLERPARSLTDRLMFWREAPPPGIPVDPGRESQRLRENAALGRDSTDGQTPIIQPQRRGWFSGLFGG